jgi:hypothetical protein
MVKTSIAGLAKVTIKAAGHERDHADSKLERNSIGGDACDPNRVCQRCDDVRAGIKVNWTSKSNGFNCGKR